MALEDRVEAKMNWRDRIVVDWPNDLQKAHRCRQALLDLERSLLELSGLGHPLHVEEGYRPPPPPGWPKAMFHLLAGSRVAYCQADLDELGPDWYPTMDEARHAAGLIKQYQRGGIFNRTLPTNLSQTPQEIKKNLEETVRMREQQAKFVNDMRSRNRAGFHGQIVMSEEALHNEPDIPEKDEVVIASRRK